MRKISFLFMFVALLLSACTSTSSSSIQVDRQDIQYTYFEKLYNDVSLLINVVTAIENQNLEQAKLMTKVYTSQRLHLYDAVENEVYQSIQEIYDQETVDLLQDSLEQYHEMIWELDSLLQEDETNPLTKAEWQRMAKQIRKINMYVFPKPEKSTNVTLSMINIASYPEQNKAEHGLEEIKDFIGDFNQAMVKLHSIVNK